MELKRIAHAPIWTWGEIVWYIKWWVYVITLFFHKLYQFGEWILSTNVRFINLYDQFWDEIEENIKEIHRSGLD